MSSKTARKGTEAAPVQGAVEQIAAVKALQNGTASEHQQRLAFKWIVQDICGMGSVPYVPGDSHAGAFLAGRIFVARQIMDAATTPMKQKVSHVRPSTVSRKR